MNTGRRTALFDIYLPCLRTFLSSNFDTKPDKLQKSSIGSLLHTVYDALLDTTQPELDNRGVDKDSPTWELILFFANTFVDSDGLGPKTAILINTKFPMPPTYVLPDDTRLSLLALNSAIITDSNSSLITRMLLSPIFHRSLIAYEAAVLNIAQTLLLEIYEKPQTIMALMCVTMLPPIQQLLLLLIRDTISPQTTFAANVLSIRFQQIKL